MADLLFEVDDALMSKLTNMAHGRGLSLEDYVRRLIIAEARRDQPDEVTA